MAITGKVTNCLLLVILVANVPCILANFWARCPKKCTCRSSWIRGVTTVSVDCSSKNIVKIPTIRNGMPKDVTRLILYKNFLQEIPAGAFRGLKYLKELYLYENFISKIDKSAFNGLRRLKTLSIHHNKVTKIENSTFAHLRNLQSLHLFSNFLEEINPSTFTGLQRLKTLSLHENHLRFIPKATFNPMKQLQFLSLHRNYLTKISPGVFCLSNSLVQLYINQNKITKILDGSFTFCRNMIKLTIGYNRLTNVTRSTFDGLDRLEELFINNNHLDYLQENSFLGLGNLKQLSLKGNRLNKLESGVFKGLNALVQLSLSKNLIDELLPNMFLGLKNVIKLFLEENKITTIQSNAFIGLGNVQNLYLYRNKIADIPAHSFKGLESLVELNLGVNRITSIENEAFFNLSKLQSLSLNSNRLTLIPANVFKGLSSLQKLTLYFNSISYVAEGAFYPLKSLIVLSWNPLPALIRLNPRLRALKSNSLHCDCNALWMKQWIGKNASLASTRMICAKPERLKGKDLRKTPDEELVCDPIQVNILPSKATAIAGSSTRFQCIVSPGAAYSWIYKGKKIDSESNRKYITTTDGFLRINNVSIEDTGQFICLAENKAGISATSTSFTIGVIPRIIKYPNEIVNVERPQSSLVLPCKAEGVPEPKITWIKDGIPVAADNDHVFASDGSLIILRMKLHFQGIYTCFASNQLGKASVTSKVYLGQASMCLPSCRRDSGYCIVKHVCNCLPEFEGPACEFRKNSVATEVVREPTENNTVNGKPALVPNPTSWVYETYDVNLNQGSGDTKYDDNDTSDEDVIVDVESADEKTGTDTYKNMKQDKQNTAQNAKNMKVIKEERAGTIKPSKYHPPSLADEQTISTGKTTEKEETAKDTLSLRKVNFLKVVKEDKRPWSYIRISRSPKLSTLKMGFQIIDRPSGEELIKKTEGKRSVNIPDSRP